MLGIDPFNPHSHPMRWEPLFYQMRRLGQGEMEKFVGSPTVRGLPWWSKSLLGPNAWGIVLIPGQRTKISYVLRHGQTKQNKNNPQSGSRGAAGVELVSVFQLRWSAFRVCPGVIVLRFIPCHILQMRRTKAGAIMDSMCPWKSTHWSPSPQCDGAWSGAFGRELGLGEVGFLSRCQGRSRQELKLPAPWIWTSQPSELWEINVCCLNLFFFFFEIAASTGLIQRGVCA